MNLHFQGNDLQQKASILNKKENDFNHFLREIRILVRSFDKQPSKKARPIWSQT